MMNKAHAMMVLAGICGAASMANATLAVTQDPGIFSPCDGALVEIVWIGSSAGDTGELSWINPIESGANITLWTNHGAVAGQSFFLPGTFGLGERVDFSYEVISGGLDLFSTANEDDWGQFDVDSTNPHDVIVLIEDIRLPGGDGDFNDAMFHVKFTCTPSVPAPGSLALLGAGGLMMGRRRRS